MHLEPAQYHAKTAKSAQNPRKKHPFLAQKRNAKFTTPPRKMRKAQVPATQKCWRLCQHPSVACAYTLVLCDGHPGILPCQHQVRYHYLEPTVLILNHPGSSQHIEPKQPKLVILVLFSLPSRPRPSPRPCTPCRAFPPAPAALPRPQLTLLPLGSAQAPHAPRTVPPSLAISTC